MCVCMYVCMCIHCTLLFIQYVCMYVCMYVCAYTVHYYLSNTTDSQQLHKAQQVVIITILWIKLF